MSGPPARYHNPEVNGPEAAIGEPEPWWNDSVFDWVNPFSYPVARHAINYAVGYYDQVDKSKELAARAAQDAEGINNPTRLRDVWEAGDGKLLREKTAQTESRIKQFGRDQIVNAAIEIPLAVTGAGAADELIDAARRGDKLNDARKLGKKNLYGGGGGAAVDSAKVAGGKSAVEIHHLLPQSKKLRPFFERAGLDVKDFTIPLDKAKHRLKPDGIHTNGGGNWNRVWEDYFEKNPTANKHQILDKLAHMREEFGI